MKTTSYSFPVAVTILLGLVFSLTGCGGSSVPTTDNSGTVRDSSVENKLPAAGEPIAGMVSASQPLMDMAASLIAARNGGKSSSVKADAARANGQKGGRPRLARAG